MPGWAIEVVEEGHSWPRQGAHARTELTEALPGRCLNAEHVGSTSVPGVTAALERHVAGEEADGPACTKRETELIRRVVDSERASRGLPLVSVSG